MGLGAGEPLWSTRRPSGSCSASLREHGELTPTAAAMLTSLTAAEAAKRLERLAREGHLEARVRDGAIAYALRERDRLALSEPAVRRPPTKMVRPSTARPSLWRNP